MNREVLVLRHDDRARPLGVPPDGIVGRRRQAAVDYMLRLMTLGLDPARQTRRELGIDEKRNYALRSTG